MGSVNIDVSKLRGDAAALVLFWFADGDAEDKAKALRKIAVQCGSVDGQPLTEQAYDNLTIVRAAELMRLAGDALQSVMSEVNVEDQAKN